METIRQISKAAPLVGFNELTPARQPTSLVGEELNQFQILCRQMLSYYPSQEFATDTIDGFLLELERLAVKHGLSRLKQALIELRGKPGQKFCPHPTEVAEAIELQMEAERDVRQSTAEKKRAARERAERIEFFWTELVPDRIKRCGWTEEECLRRFPEFKGTESPTQSDQQGVGPRRSPCRSSNVSGQKRTIQTPQQATSGRIMSHSIKREKAGSR